MAVKEAPVNRPNLHNLIESNYFFSQGAETHHNFQANIQMPLAGSPKHMHLNEDVLSPAAEPELTIEQQMQQQFQEAQAGIIFNVYEIRII